MGIYDQVNEQMKDAMRSKDRERLNALRNIRTAFINELKKNNAETLSDEQCQGALRQLAKQRKDSIDAYMQAGRADLAGQEQAELSVIEGFLPQLADAAQTRLWVQEAIAQVGATEPSHAGKVMGALMRAHRTDIDGTLAKQIVAEALQG